MARKPRIEFPHALYHVIARGNQRRNIFLESADYSKYLGLVARYKENYDFRLFAYALMINHIHLLIETGDAPLSKIMQGLQQTYTQYFNWKYDQIGHVFHGRYKALLCQKDAYLLELVRYIHLNPIRAGIVNDLARYPWTSHLIYIRSSYHPLVNKTPVLQLFHSNLTRARKFYMQFIRDGMKRGHTAFLDDVSNGRILGKQSFVEVCQNTGDTGNVAVLSAKRPSMICIFETICECHKVRPEVVQLKFKTAAVVTMRRLFSYVARVHYQYGTKEIGTFLGLDPTTITKQVQRIDWLMRMDRNLGNRITQLLRLIKETNADFQA
jgi:REP element-mobilizing transposase RayT